MKTEKGAWSTRQDPIPGIHLDIIHGFGCVGLGVFKWNSFCLLEYNYNSNSLFVD